MECAGARDEATSTIESVSKTMHFWIEQGHALRRVPVVTVQLMSIALYVDGAPV
jgi:hypothetical protein